MLSLTCSSSFPLFQISLAKFEHHLKLDHAKIGDRVKQTARHNYPFK